MPFEYFEHRADIGIRGIGRTVEEAFEQVALALFGIMVEIEEIHPVEKQIVEVKGLDYEELLMAWLSELIYLKDIEAKMYVKFEILQMTDTNLKAQIYGQAIDFDKLKLKLEVKAATWTQLSVSKKEDYWIAQCVVDV
ncbi:MAG: archease [Candidatus Hodarchaeales archaeon]